MNMKKTAQERLEDEKEKDKIRNRLNRQQLKEDQSRSGKLKKKQQQQAARLRQQKHRAAKKSAAAAEALPSATEATSTTQITTSRKLMTEQKDKKRVYYRDYRRNARMNRTRQKVVADRLIYCDQKAQKKLVLSNKSSSSTNHHHPPYCQLHLHQSNYHDKQNINVQRRQWGHFPGHLMDLCQHCKV